MKVATAAALAERLGISKRPNSKGWFPMRCPVHNGDNPESLGFKDNGRRPGGSLDVKCWKSCDGDEVRHALQERTNLTLCRCTTCWEASQPLAATNGRAQAPQPRPSTRRPSGPTDSGGYNVGEIWSATYEIPAYELHPARRWLKSFGLWRPGEPLPDGLHWRPDANRNRAGALVVNIAPMTDWQEAWPDTPAPRALALKPLTRDGKGAGPHQTIGVMESGVTVLGDPRESHALGYRQTEAMPDALAVASRWPTTAVCVHGSQGPATDWRTRPHPSVDMETVEELARDLEAEGLPRWEARRHVYALSGAES